jgi:hypothetical protein
MKSLEEHFADVERAASSIEKLGSAVVDNAKQLRKAAISGDLADLKKWIQRTSSAMTSMSPTLLRNAWPLSDSEEEVLLEQHYPSELLALLRQSGIPAFVHGGEVMAFPFVLRIVGKDRAIRINGKKSSVLRPSAVRELLERNRRPKYSNDRILETLYSAYRIVTSDTGTSRAVTLRRIYEALTLLPGSETDYTDAQFVRDIYSIDREGPRQTKSGAHVSLVGSTGTKNKRDVFAFIGPEGELVEYFGIQFSERGE